MTFGLTPTGFTPKTIEDIKSEIEADLKSAFGSQFKMEAQSVAGVLIGIFSEQVAKSWDAVNELYQGLNPDTASGVNLARLCAITGTVQKGATKTTVIVRCSGTSGTTVQAGSIVSVVGTSDRFLLLNDAVIGFAGYDDVVAEAEFAGPITAYAGTVTVINTPVSGWTSVTNLADHLSLGRNIESDPELRLRREAELRAGGNGTAAAIEREVGQISGVEYVRVYQNDTDSVVDGRPAHSIEAVVKKSGSVTNAQVAKAIFVSKSAGIEAYGATTVTVLDDNLNSHSIGLTNAVAVTPTLILGIRVTQKFMDNQTANTTALKQAVSSDGAVGNDLLVSQLIKTALTAGIQGLIDVEYVNVNGGGQNNLAIDYNEYVKVNTSNVTVVIEQVIAGDWP